MSAMLDRLYVVPSAGNEGEGESSEEEDSSSSGEDDSSSGSEDEQEEAPTGQAAQ